MILPQRLRVLVVDDNAYARAVADATLRQLGVGTVEAVESGAAGVKALLHDAYDVLLLDWYMPDMNGAALLQIIRGRGFGPHGALPVLVTTAYPNRETIARARELGASEVMSKPYTPTQLAGAIARLVPSTWHDLRRLPAEEPLQVLL